MPNESTGGSLIAWVIIVAIAIPLWPGTKHEVKVTYTELCDQYPERLLVILGEDLCEAMGQPGRRQYATNEELCLLSDVRCVTQPIDNDAARRRTGSQR